MATIGQVLATPEAGWRRYDDNHTSIKYSANGWNAVAANANHYGVAPRATAATDGKVSFDFVGTKLRIMQRTFTDNRTAIISIDGVIENYAYRVSGYCILVYEKTGLEDKRHKVEITWINDNVGSNAPDAIDIDSTGYLVTPVGQVLTTPEPGWKRYDDTEACFKYTGSWNQTAGTDYYKTYAKFTTDMSSAISFKFTGNKFRLISTFNNAQSNNVAITIDGVKYQFSPKNAVTTTMILVFEKMDLSNAVHQVEIKNESAGNFTFDAIDIDSTGRLLHSDEVTDLRLLTVGKRIRCNYIATNNTVGTFRFLGEETKNFIPAASSAVPDGDFYLICVDNDRNENRVLIPDRNIQNNVSWDALNIKGLPSGVTVMKYNSSFLYNDNASYLKRIDYPKELITKGIDGNASTTFEVEVQFANTGILRILSTTIGGGTNNRFKLLFYAYPTSLGLAVRGNQADAYSSCDVGFPALELNKTYHIAVDFSFATKIGKFYVDGVFVGQASCTASGTAWAGGVGNYGVYGFALYDSDAGWGPTAGRMKNFRLWRVSRTAQEIAKGYRNEVKPTDTGLIAWYPFDDGGGTVLTDIVGGYHATVTDATMWVPSVKAETPISARLLTGGISATDKDSEWDKYIVNSTVKNTISPGDNNVWNWSGVYSWGQTTAVGVDTGITPNSTSRMANGNTAVNRYSFATSNVVAATIGFRPLFIIKSHDAILNLVNDDGVIKTITNGVWVSLGAVPLTEELYITQGFNINKLTDALLKQLTTCTILTYSFLQLSEIKVKFAPKPIVLKPIVDINLFGVQGIDFLNLVGTMTGNGIIKTLVSKDSGQKWYTYADEWSEVDISDLRAFSTSGMAPAVLNNITRAQWDAFAPGSKLRIAYYLDISSSTDTAFVDTLTTQLDMLGTWKLVVPGTTYDVEYGNDFMRVSFYTDGSYKINY